jgi:PAS domain-containing protein
MRPALRVAGRGNCHTATADFDTNQEPSMPNASWSEAPPEAALTQVEAQAALRDSEERFRAFVTAGTDVVYRMNADWSELCHLVGRNFVADVPRPTDGWLAEYIYPEDQTRVLATIAEAIRTRGVFEMEHRCADWTAAWAGCTRARCRCSMRKGASENGSATPSTSPNAGTTSRP